jgi:hypothetical protein
MGIPGLGESKPEGEDKLEGVVEWEPVNNRDQALKDTVIVRYVSQNIIKRIRGYCTSKIRTQPSTAH